MRCAAPPPVGGLSSLRIRRMFSPLYGGLIKPSDGCTRCGRGGLRPRALRSLRLARSGFGASPGACCCACAPPPRTASPSSSSALTPAPPADLPAALPATVLRSLARMLSALRRASHSGHHSWHVQGRALKGPLTVKCSTACAVLAIHKDGQSCRRRRLTAPERRCSLHVGAQLLGALGKALDDVLRLGAAHLRCGG